MPPGLISFLSGAVTMGFAFAGLGFLRLWAKSRDPLFLSFAGAFWLLTVPPLTALAIEPDRGEGWIYLFRIAAYGLIIVAVIRKNLARGQRRVRPATGPRRT